MIPSSSQFLNIRGIEYHIREWGSKTSQPIFFLHGWMDVSASFQFVVDELKNNWRVIAPDWRGFGLSEWVEHDYWFQDYIADLNFILETLAPNRPVPIVGHSMGGNIAAIFAGIKPNCVNSLILAEGFALRPSDPTRIISRHMRWLDSMTSPKRLKPYTSFSEVSERLRVNNPKLTLDRANFLAKHWAKEQSPGHIVLRADPKHKNPSPFVYQPNEAIQCWKNIDCPVLWIHSDSDWLDIFMKNRKDEIDQYRDAFKNLEEFTIEESSHMMHLDQPKQFAKAIENFIVK